MAPMFYYFIPQAFQNELALFSKFNTLSGEIPNIENNGFTQRTESCEEIPKEHPPITPSTL